MTGEKRVRVWRGEDGWRWTAWASSDKVATSGEGYTRKAHALEMVHELFPEAAVEVDDGDDDGDDDE